MFRDGVVVVAVNAGPPTRVEDASDGFDLTVAVGRPSSYQ
jgi:hypothetical protein